MGGRDSLSASSSVLAKLKAATDKPVSPVPGRLPRRRTTSQLRGQRIGTLP
jgi:hypothetical protein